MTPGGLAACMLLAVRSLQPLRRGLTIWSRYQSFVAAQARLKEIADMPLVDDPAKPALPPVRGGLELRNVTLRRKAGAPIFDDLCLTIRAGECIAIQGDSGSGKSSLMSLLNGMNQPDEGLVLADGHSLSEFCADSVQREIGLLPQTGALIAGTLLDNMTMFEDDRKEIALGIAAQLGLDRLVAGMKLGYETPLGEASSESLPTGVRQIIAIARVLAKNPSVILFDEANNSLDMEGDQRLLEYVKQLKGRCTVVLITHRPSWHKLADRTLRIADGKLVEGFAAASFAAANTENAGSAVRDRPPPADDFSTIIREHYDEESDLSLCVSPLLRAIGWQGGARQLMVAMPHMQRSLDISGLCATMANLGMPPYDFAGTLAGLDSPPDALLVRSREGAGQGRPGAVAGRTRALFRQRRGRRDGAAGRRRSRTVYVFKEQEKVTVLSRHETNFSALCCGASAATSSWLSS